MMPRIPIVSGNFVQLPLGGLAGVIGPNHCMRRLASHSKIATNCYKNMRATDHILDEVNHPTVYHTPRQLSFLEIDIDTDQPKWTLHGVSDRGEIPENAIQGYNSTCELEVVKRGTEIRLPTNVAGSSVVEK
jgi:hypothetical protein